MSHNYFSCLYGHIGVFEMRSMNVDARAVQREALLVQYVDAVKSRDSLLSQYVEAVKNRDVELVALRSRIKRQQFWDGIVYLLFGVFCLFSLFLLYRHVY